MKKISMAVTAMVAAMSMSAFAAPVEMTEQEMGQIVAGKTLYIWENMDGEQFVSNHPNKAPGHKNGWVGSSLGSCDTDTLACDTGGSIESVYNETTEKFDWVYTGPAI